MLVPSTRLLRLTALVVLPLATLAGVVPASGPLAAGLITAGVLLAVFDALRGAGGLDAFGVSLPGVVRLSNGRPGRIAVQFRNDTGRAAAVRFGLALPPQIVTPEETRDLQLPAAPLATLDWPLTPQVRGTHRVTGAHLETASPFGLWDVRRRLATRCEVRVYPDLLVERRAVAAVFLNRGAGGAHARRQIGRGREFEKLREYLPGDALDEIHWKATAKRSQPVTKVFQIERTQEVYVIVDASRLSARDASSSSVSEPGTGIPPGRRRMGRPPAGREDAASACQTTAETRPEPETTTAENTLDRCLKAALLLGAAAERQGDMFGLVAFDDQVRRFVRARRGRSHFAACRDALHALQSRPVSPDFEELCSFLRLRLRRRALLIFLTSLDDPVLSENFVRGVSLIARQHLVLVVQPRPPGAQPLFEHPGVDTVDDVFRQLGGHLRWQSLRTLEHVLRRHQVAFTLTDHAALTAEVVRMYLEVKRRQIL